MARSSAQNLAPLPIDAVLAQAVEALRDAGNLVLIAPPGAGKTTRVPPAVLAAGLAEHGEIVVLQPRRLAARMAAQRVAAEMGEAVGRTVGYEVRFDRAVSRHTRIRFVTEGVLTRQLMADPELRRTAVVLIDEFHERHLAGDLALALLRHLQTTRRPELRVAIMSATLEPEPVARFLGDCPVVESEGRLHPVDIEYAADTGPAGRKDLVAELPLERQVSAALRSALAHGLDGHALVFLPGAREIRRAMEACADVVDNPSYKDVTLLPLHGDLPAAEQDRAVAPSPQRKVIFATNVAETSITIDGVVCVIDSGLARVARHSPWSGIATLRIEPISQASAAQRAGRAGRTRPGRCVRLYHQHDHDTRRPFDTPEVERVDLTDAALLLHAAGVERLDEFGWFEAPPAPAVAHAEELLGRLGAVDDGRLTDIGRRMLRFPVHPRQARMLVAAEDLGVAEDGSILAALVGQRELRAARRTKLHGQDRAAEVAGPSDLLEDLDQLGALAAREQRRGSRNNLRARARAAELDPSVATAVYRIHKKLARLMDSSHPAPKTEEAREQALLMATLAGYPDRVARRRSPRSKEIVFAAGGSATLARSSVVADAQDVDFMVAIDAEERGRGGGASVLVRRASAVDPAWLLELFIDRIRDTDELAWHDRAQRVERVRRMYYDDLVIDEERDPGGARDQPERAAAVLADAALAAGLDKVLSQTGDRDAVERWRARTAFAAQVAGSLRPPDDDDLAQALRLACTGLTSFAELARVSILDIVQSAMDPGARRLVERLAPATVSLPGRRRVPVHYEHDRPPWIESRLQDFFGLDQGPTVAAGQVPLVLHLLAPNRRAVQVTSDLSGFWSRHYPEVRRQLMRRYPKHAWPEDPLKGHSR